MRRFPDKDSASSQTPRPLALRRSFGFKLVGGLVLAILAQTVIFSAIVDRTVGAGVPVANLLEPGSNALSTRLRVAVLDSAATAQMDSEGGEGSGSLSRQWLFALEADGAAVRLISDEELTEALRNSADVVILPASICLSEQQRQTIGGILEAGIGIVATGATGARDETCAWRGFEFIEDTFGLDEPAAVTIPSESYAAFRGGRYYSGAVPAGYRLTVPVQELVFGAAAEPDIFWTDRRLRPVLNLPASQLALGLHGEKGKGRFVWFGFQETLPDSSPLAERELLNQFLAATARWAGRHPLATFFDWPGQATSAALITELVDMPGDTAVAADVFESHGIPVTFFVSGETRVSQNSLRILSDAGELATSGDSLEAFADQEQAVQTGRLINAKAGLEATGYGTILGFHPPQGVWDEATVASLRSGGYRYFIDEPTYTSAVPELITDPNPGLLSRRQPELVRIPSLYASDIEAIANYTGPAGWDVDLADEFLKDLHRSQYIGGLYTLKFHSSLLGAPGNESILDALANKIKAEQVWLTGGTDLAEWWSGREQLRLDARLLTPTRLRLSVTNTGATAFRNADLRLYLPHQPATVRVIPELLGRPIPATEVQSDDTLHISFEELEPETSYVYVIALDESVAQD